MKMKMKNFLITASLVLPTLTTFANVGADLKEGSPAKKAIITIDENALNYSEKKFGNRVKLLGTTDGISALEIDEDALPWFGLLMHKDFQRCAGYVRHDDFGEAENFLNSGEQKFQASFERLVGYEINQTERVQAAIKEVSSTNIYNSILKLSSFTNRYYKGANGKASAQWIFDEWTKLGNGRSDIKVEYFKHSSWDQPSVVMTIQGKSNEIVIVGGHQDSISGYFSGENVRAPGADDNASGISTITEVARIFISKSIKPEKTIKFIAYAAEEVGLLGSKEIAKNYKEQGANVIGVMQLDMTNFKGSKDFDIVLMNDYTNAQQNKFIGTLVETYMPTVKWGYDSCGYACSDHASWHMQGYPASVPFESKMNEMNKRIHTANDLLSVSGDNAEHAAKFARLALAYIIELGK